MTEKLLNRLKNLILDCTNEPSKQELTAAVTKVFKDKTAKAKEEKKQATDKPKRKPSAYNIFYKEQSVILREQEQGKAKNECMSAKEKMAYIASLWKAKKDGKETADNNDIFASASEEEEEVEAEEEPKPVAATKAKKADGAAKSSTVAKKQDKPKKAKVATKKTSKTEEPQSSDDDE